MKLINNCFLTLSLILCASNYNRAFDFSDIGKAFSAIFSNEKVGQTLEGVSYGLMGPIAPAAYGIPKLISLIKNQTETTPSPLSCGRKAIYHNSLIVKGKTAKPGDWPWHAAMFKISKRRQSNYICGGSLLSETRVLTAGHCVVEYDSVVLPERLIVVLGKHNLIGGDNHTQEKGVFEVILHPHFKSHPLLNDIAILKLISKVTYTAYVQPVCLWTSSDEATKSDLFGKYGYIVGWGFTEDIELALELKFAKLPVATDYACLRSNPNFFGIYLTEQTYCVGHNNGVNACNGDSGGGYFFPVDEGDQQTWYVRGIVSLSVSRQNLPICDPNEYTIFTDVNQHMDFIKQHI